MAMDSLDCMNVLSHKPNKMTKYDQHLLWWWVIGMTEGEIFTAAPVHNVKNTHE